MCVCGFLRMFYIQDHVICEQRSLHFFLSHLNACYFVFFLVKWPWPTPLVQCWMQAARTDRYCSVLPNLSGKASSLSPLSTIVAVGQCKSLKWEWTERLRLHFVGMRGMCHWVKKVNVRFLSVTSLILSYYLHLNTYVLIPCDSAFYALFHTLHNSSMKILLSSFDRVQEMESSLWIWNQGC